MNLNLYTIYDAKTHAYDRIMSAQADGEALRIFKDLAVSADHPIGQHPEDYSLFRIGTYDNQTATITVQKQTCLGHAHEFAAQAQTVDPEQMGIFKDTIKEVG